MSKRKALDAWDPIEAEARIIEREQYLQQLFVPVIPELAHRPTRWLVQDLIPAGYLCLLAAEPKEGKTSLATALALAVATGSPFAGRQTQQGSVLWISAEESLRERSLLLDQSPFVDSALPLYTCYQHLAIDDEQALDAIQYWVFETGAKLVVVDPLLAATSGRSLRDGWNARRSLQALKRFCDRVHVSALVLHHRKDAKHGLARSRAAENDQLTATASLVMSMKVRKLEDQEPPFPLSTGGRRVREKGLQWRAFCGWGMGVCEAAPDREGVQEFPSPCLQGEGAGGEGLRSCHHSPTTTHHSPTTSHHPRLIALECSGRGDFANQTIWLLSHGPLDYVAVNGTIEEAPPPELGDSEVRILQAIERRPKDSGQLLDEIKILRIGTIRNVLARLRRKGLIEVRVWKDGVRHYALTPKGRTYVLEMKELEKNANENDENGELDSK